MNPDIQWLADKAAEKIRGGYSAPHAINSALKELNIPTEEKEALRREIAQELNRRSQLRRRKKSKANQEAARRAKMAASSNAPAKLDLALKKIIQEEQIREAQHMAYERRDHLLSDL